MFASDTGYHVTIILPLRNEYAHLKQLVLSVTNQTYPSSLSEYIFVTAPSVDGTREALHSRITNRNECEPVMRIIDNPDGHVSPAMNLGIAHASGRIIIRMDAHTRYADDYVEQCVRVLLETGAQNVGGPARTVAHTRMGRAIAAAYHSPFSVGGARFHDVDYEGEVDTVTYGCWWRQYLLDIGGFDEDLVRNQDDELNLRIIRNGGKVYQSPRIRSWYSPRASLGALFRQYFQYGYWKVRVIRKHRLPASPRHLVPVLFLFDMTAGWVIAPLWSTLLFAQIGVCGLYLAALVAFSLQAARTHGWDLFPLLPAVFATYHVSYGAGFLTGLVDQMLPARVRDRRRGSAAVTGLSR